MKNLLKLVLSNLFAALPMLLFFALYVLPVHEGKFLSNRQDSSKAVVETAYSVAAAFEARAAAGEMSADQAKTAAQNVISKMHYSGNEYFWIHDLGLKMVMHSAKPELNGTDIGSIKDPNGKQIFREMNQLVEAQGEGMVGYMWPKPGAGKPVDKLSYVKLFKPWNWVIGSGAYLDDVQREVSVSKRTMYGWLALVILLSVAISIFSGVIHSRNLVQPIQVASKKLSENVLETSAVTGKLREHSQALTEGTSRVATAIAQSAATIEEISSLVSRTGESVRHVATVSAENRESAENGRKVVGDLKTSLEDMLRSAAQINEITRTIDDLAFQTNLLALNAAVEAARAGEHGRGFAVVSEAVGSLAVRSAEAAKKIALLSTEIGTQIKVSSEVASSSYEILNHVAESSEKVAVSNQEISLASEEQTKGLMQINQAMAEIDHVSQSSAALAEQTLRLSEDLNHQSGEVQELASDLARRVS